MANLAYQVTGFAYQGSGQFAYQGSADGPDPAPSAAIRNFSLREWRQWHRPEEELERRGLDQESSQIIADVALRQSQDLHLDEQQRLDEFRGEMQLRGLSVKSAHFEALASERSLLIDAEIKKRLHSKLDAEEVALLLTMIAASL